jgi:hypothetical protein
MRLCPEAVSFSSLTLTKLLVTNTLSADKCLSHAEQTWHGGRAEKLLPKQDVRVNVEYIAVRIGFEPLRLFDCLHKVLSFSEDGKVAGRSSVQTWSV